MPIEVNHCVNTLFKSLYSAKLTNTIFLNPICMTGCIIALMFLILYLTGAPFRKLHVFRITLYLFMVIYGLLVVHFSLCKHDVEKSMQSAERKSIIDTIGKRVAQDNTIQPRLSPDTEQDTSKVVGGYAQSLNTDAIKEDIGSVESIYVYTGSRDSSAVGGDGSQGSGSQDGAVGGEHGERERQSNIDDEDLFERYNV